MRHKKTGLMCISKKYPWVIYYKPNLFYELYYFQFKEEKYFFNVSLVFLIFLNQRNFFFLNDLLKLINLVIIYIFYL